MRPLLKGLSIPKGVITHRLRTTLTLGGEVVISILLHTSPHVLTALLRYVLLLRQSLM